MIGVIALFGAVFTGAVSAQQTQPSELVLHGGTGRLVGPLPIR
jgi:hypothetical protein